MTVHVVGNVCVDWRMRVPRLPRAGETLNASDLAFDLGGKGALQALAAHRAGAAVRLYAAVGADADAAVVRAGVAAAGLPADLVVVDAPTDRSVILVDARAENLVVSAVAAARAFRPAGWADAAATGDLLVVQNNLDPAVTAGLLAEARRRGLAALWNLSPLGDGMPPDLTLADVAVVNRGEGEALTGTAEPPEILARLRRQGARAAVITLGAAGALVLAPDDAVPTRVAAPAVAAVDTSGAGDVFAGVLAGLMDRGHGLAAAAKIATAAASIAVTRAGTWVAVPSPAEIAAAAEAAGGTPVQAHWRL